jgi:hypothetical protein
MIFNNCLLFLSHRKFQIHLILVSLLHSLTNLQMHMLSPKLLNLSPLRFRHFVLFQVKPKFTLISYYFSIIILLYSFLFQDFNLNPLKPVIFFCFLRFNTYTPSCVIFKLFLYLLYKVITLAYCDLFLLRLFLETCTKLLGR